MMTGTSWVIRGARPLGAEPADITITDGTITAIGDGGGQRGAQELDAAVEVLRCIVIAERHRIKDKDEG